MNKPEEVVDLNAMDGGNFNVEINETKNLKNPSSTKDDYSFAAK